MARTLDARALMARSTRPHACSCDAQAFCPTKVAHVMGTRFDQKVLIVKRNSLACHVKNAHKCFGPTAQQSMTLSRVLPLLCLYQHALGMFRSATLFMVGAVMSRQTPFH